MALDDITTDEMKTCLKTGQRAAQEMQAEEQQEAWNRFVADTWSDALESAGLTQESYAQLSAQDVTHVQDVMKKGMKALTMSVAARAQARKKGKQPVSPQSQVQPQAKRPSPHRQKLTEIRERGEGTNEDIELMLEAILPDDGSAFWPK
jgi:3-oxoacyl-(acyl-carrier-protein) synthase